MSLRLSHRSNMAGLALLSSLGIQVVSVAHAAAQVTDAPTAAAPASPDPALPVASASPSPAPNGDAVDDPSPAASARPSPIPRPVDSSSCSDDWPAERERPKIIERFPKRGISGHVARLELSIEHLPGEIVFPAGLETMQMISGELSEERVALTEAQFKLPDPKSDVQPTLERPSDAAAGRVKTELSFPLIPLPKEAGRFELTLPRLPIAVARASGQVHTICTQPHVITVEDPLASEPNPAKKPDPNPRPQLEIWTSLRDAVLVASWLVPLVLVLVWLLYRYRDRFKKKPIPPPPIPPWERARGQLAHLESKGLLDRSEFEAYLDGVTDTLREYLGGRYGFEGLECTTRELLRQLGSRAPDFSEEQTVRTILQRADLVKFARRTPSEEECTEAMRITRRIIDVTVPTPSLDPRAQTGAAATPTAKSASPSSPREKEPKR